MVKDRGVPVLMLMLMLPPWLGMCRVLVFGMWWWCEVSTLDSGWYDTGVKVRKMNTQV